LPIQLGYIPKGDPRKREGEHFDLPIFFFTQTLGWALGGEIDKLGLKRCISGRSQVKGWMMSARRWKSYV
jgi:heterodisulfide reductase subunit B